MKICPYCAEEIQDAAIKCKHCGEFLEGSVPPPLPGNGLKWYFRTTTVVIALFSVGPLALPLIWWHPKLDLWWKIGISVATVLLTWYVVRGTMEALDMFNEQMKTLQQGGMF